MKNIPPKLKDIDFQHFISKLVIPNIKDMKIPLNENSFQYYLDYANDKRIVDDSINEKRNILEECIESHFEILDDMKIWQLLQAYKVSFTLPDLPDDDQDDEEYHQEQESIFQKQNPITGWFQENFYCSKEIPDYILSDFQNLVDMKDGKFLVQHKDWELVLEFYKNTNKKIKII